MMGRNRPRHASEIEGDDQGGEIQGVNYTGVSKKKKHRRRRSEYRKSLSILVDLTRSMVEISYCQNTLRKKKKERILG